MTLFMRFFSDESGATGIEYALLAVMVGIVSIGALTAFGSAVTGKFSYIRTNVAGSGS